MPQMGFFDLSDRYASPDAKKDPLVEINAVVPWDAFRPLLERVWRKPDEARKSRAGQPALTSSNGCAWGSCALPEPLSGWRWIVSPGLV